MELNDASLKEFRKILKWVLDNPYSKYYNRKYKGRITSAKIKSVDDFRKIPFLTREEINEVDPFERFFGPQNKIDCISVSSGTSDKGPLVNLIQNQSLKIGNKQTTVKDFVFDSVVRKLGIKSVMMLRPAHVLNFFRYEEKDIYLIFGETNNLALSAQIIAKVKVEAISLSPTTLYFLTPYLKEVYDLKKIKYLEISGEACSEAQLNLFRSMYPNAYITSTYGGVEDGVRAWKCDSILRKNWNLFHVLPLSFFECVDPVTGEIVENGERGELVRTSLNRGYFIPIRYRTGDMGIIKKEKCECGRKEPLIEVIGRIGLDSVNMHGLTILASDVLTAIDKVGGLENDFKAHIYERVNRGKINYAIVLQLVPKNKKMIGNESYIQRISDKIEKNFYVAPTLTYYDLVQKDVLLPIKVELIGEIPIENKRKHFLKHY